MAWREPFPAQQIATIVSTGSGGLQLRGATAIRQHVCAGPVLHADDTTVPVLAPGLGRTRSPSRLSWLVRRDRGIGRR
jgi:hypothetical protein